ncbi:helix-turn-helix domain-containing protein [Reinekea sp.]|jgi:AcrR family transcriptional regulator|uniref:TetR/AcrR family transcriptional regulator n=1 Tax=Reinekea sp. TaxID=1970455 RepID=UPI002A7F5D43|nr:helix-turn-helix domain-containing protein [Reinekea sp.]
MAIRDRVETEQRLITAAGQVLARDGFGKLGVNAIARQAGVDKVLIYRYFDGLPGLIKAYAKQGDFWPGVDELMAEPLATFQLRTAADQMATIMTHLAAGIRKRPITLEILSWEMVERNALTVHLEELREQEGFKLAAMLGFHHPSDGPESAHVDVAALVAIMVGSINYLSARSQHIKHFNGIAVQDDAGWQRLTDTLRLMCEKLL